MASMRRSTHNTPFIWPILKLCSPTPVCFAYTSTMKKLQKAVSVLALVAAPQIYADTMAGRIIGSLDSVEVDAATGTNIIYAKHGEDAGKDFQPWPITGDWTFTFNGDKVNFAGTFLFGDYQTYTDAGSMGGISKQIFYGFSHNVKGTASFDEAAGTLTFNKSPDGRDDEGAGTATQSKGAECEKVKGMFAGKACSAFAAASPGLEGLKLNFKFNEERTAFEGQAALIQYGGKGITESETEMLVNLKGELAAK
jgi:hypothetical protein